MITLQFNHDNKSEFVLLLACHALSQNLKTGKLIFGQEAWTSLSPFAKLWPCVYWCSVWSCVEVWNVVIMIIEGNWWWNMWRSSEYIKAFWWKFLYQTGSGMDIPSILTESLIILFLDTTSKYNLFRVERSRILTYLTNVALFTPLRLSNTLCRQSMKSMICLMIVIDLMLSIRCHLLDMGLRWLSSKYHKILRGTWFILMCSSVQWSMFIRERVGERESEWK